MITTDDEGKAMVTLPAIEDRFRAAQGADEPGLYEGGGVPSIDWRKASRTAGVVLLTLAVAASLLLSLANRWFP